eukprot:2205725-Rhodomonas_salina.2
MRICDEVDSSDRFDGVIYTAASKGAQRASMSGCCSAMHASTGSDHHVPSVALDHHRGSGLGTQVVFLLRGIEGDRHGRAEDRLRECVEDRPAPRGPTLDVAVLEVPVRHALLVEARRRVLHLRERGPVDHEVPVAFDCDVAWKCRLAYAVGTLLAVEQHLAVVDGRTVSALDPLTRLMRGQRAVGLAQRDVQCRPWKILRILEAEPFLARQRRVLAHRNAPFIPCLHNHPLELRRDADGGDALGDVPGAVVMAGCLMRHRARFLRAPRLIRDPESRIARVRDGLFVVVALRGIAGGLVRVGDGREGTARDENAVGVAEAAGRRARVHLALLCVQPRRARTAPLHPVRLAAEALRRSVHPAVALLAQREV